MKKIKEIVKWVSLTCLSVVILVGYGNAIGATTWQATGVSITYNVKYEREDKSSNIKFYSTKATYDRTGSIELYTVDISDPTLVPNANGCYFRIFDSISDKGVCIKDVFYIETDTTAPSDQILLIGAGEIQFTVPYTYTPPAPPDAPPTTVPMEVEGIVYVDLQGTIKRISGPTCTPVAPFTDCIEYITLKGKMAGGGEANVQVDLPGLPVDDDHQGGDELNVMFMGTVPGPKLTPVN